MTRKLQCVRIDELGQVNWAAKELNEKQLNEKVCNDDKPCDHGL